MVLTGRFRRHGVVVDSVRDYLIERVSSAGALSSTIADAIGEDRRSVDKCLRRMAARGEVTNHKVGQRTHNYVYWRAVPGRIKRSPGRVDKRGVPRSILAALAKDDRTIRDLMVITGATRDTVKQALYRLTGLGYVVRLGTTIGNTPRGPLRVALWAAAKGPSAVRAGDPDTDDWTPVPYVNPIRARALGLKVGARA